MQSYRFIGALAVLLAPAVQADMVKFNSGIDPEIVKAANQISFGVGSVHQDYSEYNDGLAPSLGNVLDAETGRIPSVRLAYAGMYRRWHLQAGLNYSQGTTEYDGFLQAPGPIYTPFVTRTDNVQYDFLVRGGYSFSLGRPAVVIPYVEVGDHYWQRRVGHSTPYYSGAEEYMHLLAGVGVKFIVTPFPHFTWEGGAGLGTNFLSTMTTQGYTYTLGDKPNISAFTAFDYRVAGNWHLRLSADYRKWEYGQSDVQGGYLEPRSWTKQKQFLLALGYSL